MIRPSRFAGRLYPADPEELASRIQAHLEAYRGLALPPSRLLLLPHAGFEAAAPLLAAGLARLPAGFEAAALVGPVHDPPPGPGFVLGEAVSRWATPLGEMEIGSWAGSPVAGAGSPEALAGFTLDPGAHAREHCLEVLAPWLRMVGPAARLLPMLVATTMEADPLLELGMRLGTWLLEGPGRVLLATTDLDHYHGPASAPGAGMRILEALEAGDPERLAGELRDDPAACGAGAVLVLAGAARALGLDLEVLALGWTGTASEGPGLVLAATREGRPEA